MPATADHRPRPRAAGRRKPPQLPGAAVAKMAPSASTCSSAPAASEVSISSSVGDCVLKQAAPGVRKRKREVEGAAILDVGVGGDDGRRITRSYYKQKKIERLVSGESEASCVESASGAASSSFNKRSASSIAEEKPVKFLRIVKRIDDNSDSDQNKAASKFDSSEISCLESISESKAEILARGANSNCSLSAPAKNSEHEFECDSKLAVAGNPRPGNFISELESGLESVPEDIAAGKRVSVPDLACSEKLSPGDESEFSTSDGGATLSNEFDSELLWRSSYEETDASEFMTQTSGSEFSQNSGTGAAPSASFQLYLHYSKLFVGINASFEVGIEDELDRGFTLMRFEDEEFEESYQRFRRWEKKHVLFNLDDGVSRGVAEEYGEMVFQQRLLMVKWIVEHSEASKLQRETLFLGVSLLDRFLSKGFFKSDKDIEILGIACCMLAIRMEENQPYNCVQEKTFTVGSNIYSRSQVVAMEWTVQEVLKFKCFLPTTYNFLCFYLKAAKANSDVEDLAKRLAVISLLDHDRLLFWPSTVAAGLVILASLAVNCEPSCNWVMETHVRTKDDDLAECIQSFEWLVKYVY